MHRPPLRLEAKTADLKARRNLFAIAIRPGRSVATAMNDVWAMDVMPDRLFAGRPLRNLTIVDCKTRKALATVERTNVGACQIIGEGVRTAHARIQSASGAAIEGVAVTNSERRPHSATWRRVPCAAQLHSPRKVSWSLDQTRGELRDSLQRDPNAKGWDGHHAYHVTPSAGPRPTD